MIPKENEEIPSSRKGHHPQGGARGSRVPAAVRPPPVLLLFQLAQ